MADPLSRIASYADLKNCLEGAQVVRKTGWSSWLPGFRTITLNGGEHVALSDIVKTFRRCCTGIERSGDVEKILVETKAMDDCYSVIKALESRNTVLNPVALLRQWRERKIWRAAMGSSWGKYHTRFVERTEPQFVAQMLVGGRNLNTSQQTAIQTALTQSIAPKSGDLALRLQRATVVLRAQVGLGEVSVFKNVVDGLMPKGLELVQALRLLETPQPTEEPPISTDESVLGQEATNRNDQQLAYNFLIQNDRSPRASLLAGYLTTGSTTGVMCTQEDERRIAQLIALLQQDGRALADAVQRRFNGLKSSTDILRTTAREHFPNKAEKADRIVEWFCGGMRVPTEGSLPPEIRALSHDDMIFFNTLFANLERNQDPLASLARANCQALTQFRKTSVDDRRQ